MKMTRRADRRRCICLHRPAPPRSATPSSEYFPVGTHGVWPTAWRSVAQRLLRPCPPARAFVCQTSRVSGHCCVSNRCVPLCRHDEACLTIRYAPPAVSLCAVSQWSWTHRGCPAAWRSVSQRVTCLRPCLCVRCHASHGIAQY